MRLLRPSLIVFCLALLASLCIHLPIYEVLGTLARALLDKKPPEPPQTVEFELTPSDAAHSHAPAKSKKAPRVQKQTAAAQPEVKPAPAQPAVVKVEPAPQRPPQPAERPLAITQKSDSPDIPPPDHARFIADQNRRVEKESVAKVRDMQRDDSEPSASAAPTPTQQKEDGNADQSEAADLREVRGSKERTANPSEAELKPEQPSQRSSGTRSGQAVPSAATEPTPLPPERAGSERAAGAPQSEPDTIVVQDSAGTFTIRKQAQGPMNDSARADGTGQPGSAREDRAGQTGRKGAELRMSWSQFEDTFGEEQLKEQRTAYLEQHRSKAAGGERQRRWREFRAAIENFVPDVQPGRETALNAAADPFAQYLAEVHRRIHREFAYGFLRSLPLAGGPFGDPELHTELEIVINGDGNIYKVGIAQSSGFLPFDYGAFNAVMRAGPYATPPRKILSADGRVYVHWGFYRNERQCGTFNARPYILANPPAAPNKGHGPMRDEGDRPHGPAVAPREGQLGMLESRPARRLPYAP